MKNPVGIYYAYWERDWDADFIPYIEKVARLGFDALEINAGTVAEMPDYKLKELSAAALANNIKLTYCIGLPQQYDLASPDSAVRQNGTAYMKKILNHMYQAGGDTLGGIIYGSWPMKGIPDMAEKERMRQRAAECLKEILKAAEQYDINCCFEIVNRFEHCLLNTASEGVAFAKELDSPKARLLLDTFHMNIEEDSFREAILTAGDLLGHFHMGECNRKTPGTGRIPWSDIFAALNEINYTGAVVMEPFVKPGGQVGSDIRVFRDLSQDSGESQLDQAAGKAAEFVKNGLLHAAL